MKKIKAAFAAVLITAVLGGCVNVNEKKNDTPPDSGNRDTEKVRSFSDVPGYVKKTETVYVSISPDGKVNDISVTDRIQTDKKNVRVEDKSSLSAIENIKDDFLPIRSGKELTWYMDATDLYYRGKSTKSLPVEFEIKYYLNDMEYPLKDIVNKSGKLKIEIRAENKEAHRGRAGGDYSVIYTPMLVLCGAAFDEDDYSSLSVLNGRTIGDGKRQFVFSVLTPGLKESLGLKDNSSLPFGIKLSDFFTVTADVKKLSSKEMYFAVIPFSSFFEDDLLTDSVGGIREMIGKIKKLSEAFQNIDPDGILKAFSGDPERISELTNAVNSSMELLKKNKKLMTVLSEYMTGENAAKFAKLAADIKNLDLEQYIAMLLNPDFQRFLSGFDDVADDINSLMPLIESLSEALSDEEVSKAVDDLPETVEELYDLRIELDKNREFIDALGRFAKNDTNDLSEIVKALNGIGGDGYGGFTKDADELTKRLEEVLALGNRYKIYTEKAEDTDSSVMFIYKTVPPA